MKFSIKEVWGKTHRRGSSESVPYLRGHQATITNDDGKQLHRTSVCATSRIAETVAQGWIRQHTPLTAAA